MYSIKAFIKMEMIKQGISNDKFAEELQVSPSLISRYFHNERTFNHLHQICDVLKLDNYFIQKRNEHFEILIQKYITYHFN